MTIRSVGAGSIMGNLACRQKRADGRASPHARVDPEAAPARPDPIGDPPEAGAGALGGVESRAVVADLDREPSLALPQADGEPPWRGVLEGVGGRPRDEEEGGALDLVGVRG